MIGDWSILPAQPNLAPQDFALKEVLAEYDGPQIVTAEWNSSLVVGVAADEDQGVIRWLFAKTTSVEAKGLALGVLPTRELYVKTDAISVVDADESFNIVRFWDGVSGLDLGDNLPDPGVLLPISAREKLQECIKTPLMPEVSISANSNSEAAGVGFRALSDILDILQRFVNAIAQSVESESASLGRYASEVVRQASLGFVQAEPGSLCISVAPSDQSLLEEALGTIRSAVECGENVAQLESLLSPRGPRVRARFEELLKVVRKNQIELLGQSGSSVAYLNPTISQRIIVAIERSTEETRHTWPATGSFIAYDSGGLKFEFVLDDDSVYEGDVLGQVAEKNQVVAVGTGATYIVLITTIIMSQWDQRRETFELTDIIRQLR
jgi:hypothetical protein